MAKAKMKETLGGFRKKAKKKRPGIHSKKKASASKKSKNYKKPYRGQGR